MNPYRVTGAVLAGVLASAGIGAAWQAVASRRDHRRFPPPGQLVDVGDHFGLLRLFRAERPFIAGLPAREYAEMRAYLARPQGWSAGADGLLAWARTSRDQVNATRALGDLPLVVLSVTEQDRYAEILTRLQTELASLSSNSEQITVAGATHYTLVSKRNFAAIVSDAVRDVSAAAQSGGVLRQSAADG